MRIGLGTVFLLAATSLVGLTQSPVAAATGCDAPDTTWVGPATEGGSTSWDEPSNWSTGVPTATSVVCIPDTVVGPHILEATTAAANAIDADGATVTLSGELTLGTTFDVGALVADLGWLYGGTTTVTDSLTGGGLSMQDEAALDQWGTAVLDEWNAQGSRITVHGDAVLASGGEIDTLGGLFTIADTGSLTYDSVEAGRGSVIGGFANHGEVSVTAGDLLMMGSSPEDAQPDQFSTGSFTGGPGSRLWISYTELRTGARIDHAQFVDHISVPAGDTATIAGSQLVGDPRDPAPSVAGVGELVVTAGTVANARIGGSLTVTVPAGEVLTMGGDATVQDQAHLQVFGELAGSGDLVLGDETKLTLEGPGASVGGVLALDNGPNATVDLRGGADLQLPGRFRNEGLVVLSPGSRLITGANFRQLATGRLVTEVDATGLGKIRAEGRRNLAGQLVVQRDPAYAPPVGTLLTVLASNGRTDSDDAFDSVASPRHGSRKFRVRYERDRVRLRVDRVG